MRYFHSISFFLFSIFFLSIAKKDPSPVFIVKPYLQIGDNPSGQSMKLLWQTWDEDAQWLIETKSGNNAAWVAAPVPEVSRIEAAGIGKRRLYTASLTNLMAGMDFTYRISKNRKPVFTSGAKALKSFDQPYRFIVTGDIGAGTKDAKLLAEQAMFAKPDLLVIPGDIVYEHGLMSEYDTNFWPVYNADSVTHDGAPLMRSIPFVGAPGNHDTETRDFEKYPDALAYYLFWAQPLNGPAINEGGPASPSLNISDQARKIFMAGAGSRFPVMSNFSFDYGNAHWLILDSNPYVDWTNKELTDWIEKDLASATNAVWRFVAFHHPGFNSSREHYEQQHMRLLSPLFEKGKVDIVFNGHVHNYQRSFPLQFIPDRKGTLLVGGRDNKTIRGRVVNGQWKLDKSFDGKTNTKPAGIIYVVTGAGGQELYNPEQNNDPDSWQKFTDRFISDVHSLSVIDVNDKKFTLRQISPEGKELDSFTITK